MKIPKYRFEHFPVPIPALSVPALIPRKPEISMESDEEREDLPVTDSGTAIYIIPAQGAR